MGLLLSSPPPRDGPSSQWLLRTGTGPAPAPPVQVPNSRIGRLPPRRVDQKGSEILLGARGPQAFRRLDSLPPHPPSRRLTWQRPCPPPASARRAPLQRPSHADLGPVARRCASGIAPSPPSLPPAAPRRRGCLTTVGTPAAASPEQDCVSLPPSPLHLYGVSLYRRCCVPCLTQRRRSAPYGGVCWLPVPPRSSPGLIRRHVSNLLLRFMQRCWRFDVHWPLSVSGRRACSVNGLFGQNCASECASDLV